MAGFVIAAGAALSVSVKAVHSGPLSALNGDGAWGFLVIGLLGMGLGLFWRRYQPDIAEAAVTWVEGRGRKEIYHYDDSPDAYGYRMGGMQFDVSERGYQALVEGLRYRAYYAPHSGELVNIEVLDRATPSAAPPTTVPVCPICGRSDRVRDAVTDLHVMEHANGCATLLLPLVVLVGKNPVSYGRGQRAQRQHMQITLARLPLMYVCRRDRVVFLPGAGKTVRTVELIRLLRQGNDAETIGRALGGSPEYGSR